MKSSYGRRVRCTLRARNAKEAIQERGIGSSWSIAASLASIYISQQPLHPTLRTRPKALLRLVRQHWAIENQWNWPRDTQLGEDEHCCSQRNGVKVWPLLRTLALNLLRCNGVRSIRSGLMALAHDISRMLGWVGACPTKTR